MRAVALCLAAVLWLPIIVQGQAKTGEPIVVAGAKQPPQKGGSVLFHVLQRRKLGLTTANVVKVLQAMKAEGALEQYRTVAGDGTVTVDTSALAVAVADRLATEAPEAWADIDWDEVIAFLEKLLELLIKFLPLILPLFI